MSVRRPRIKVRPNLSRARSGSDLPVEARRSTESPTESGSTDFKPEKDDVKPDGRKQGESSKSDTTCSVMVSSPCAAQVKSNSELIQEEQASFDVGPEKERDVKGDGTENPETVVPSGGGDSVPRAVEVRKIGARRSRIKVNPNLSARRSRPSIATSTQDPSTTSSPEVIRQMVEESSGLPEAPTVEIKNPQLDGEAENDSASSAQVMTTKRRPRIKICPNISAVAHKKPDDSTVAHKKPDDSAVAHKKPDESNGGIDENKQNDDDDAQDSVRCLSPGEDKTKQILKIDAAIVQEVMKSPTVRRGRFFRAKPNIVEAERRHQRLSSLSENDDPGTPWKTPSTSDKASPNLKLEVKSPDSNVTTETQANIELVEKKKQSRSRRRQSVKLEKLVSENRRSFTISDLIYMNPVSNPMKRYLNKEKKKKKEKDPETKEETASVTSDLSLLAPPSESTPGSPPQCEVIEDGDGGGGDGDGGEAMPVPQVMLGPDGNIVLNDASLTIKNLAAEPDPAVIESDIVVDTDGYNPSQYYKCRKRSLLWSMKETTKFYVALSSLGTDFSLMQKLFPKRDRGDLKRKFKLEERKHRALIDKALDNRITLDMSLFDASDEEDENAVQGSGGEKENIIGAVKGVLEKEQQESKAKSKSKARNKLKVKDKSNNTPPITKSASKKPKKEKKVWKSRYYDSSSEESDVKDEADATKLKQRDSEQVEVISSDDESSMLERIVENTTRSGRQPKRVIPFSMPEVKVHKRKRRAVSRSSSTSDKACINPELAPLICSSPRGMSHKVLEDTETGQRLLLVKSPEPCTPDGSSDFVHVYLMSPKPHQDNTPNVTIQQGQSDEMDVFIPPPAAAIRRPAGLQEEIITDDLQVIDSGDVHDDVVQSTSHQTPVQCQSPAQNTPQRTPSSDSPCVVQICHYVPNAQGDANVSEHMQEVMDIYENAEITTLTDDDGQIIEIFIDPGDVNIDDAQEETMNADE